MEKNYLLLSLEDDSANALGKILGDKTCKKIINYLAEQKSASEKDISDALHLPLNTIEYNLNKLLKANLIEKTKDFFWSSKGKKIAMYALSNKSIIISPKQSSFEKLKSILPAIVVSGIGFVLVKIYSSSQEQIITNAGYSKDAVMSVASESALSLISSNTTLLNSQPELWFLAGSLIAIFSIFVYQYFKSMKGGKNGKIC